jgi:hypothetical protein
MFPYISPLALDTDNQAIETSKHPHWAWLNQGSEVSLLRTHRLSQLRSSEATRSDTHVGIAPVGLRRV